MVLWFIGGGNQRQDGGDGKVAEVEVDRWRGDRTQHGQVRGYSFCSGTRLAHVSLAFAVTQRKDQESCSASEVMRGAKIKRWARSSPS